MSLLAAISLPALGKGLATSAGLIIAIGAQNAFVLTQGLRQRYQWPVALVCSLFDALFITLGIAGMGVLITQSPLMLDICRYGGSAFLIWYGARALLAALKPQQLKTGGSAPLSLKAALLTTLALTLLNPHVYLDTVVLLGSIGGQQPADERMSFAIGAISFSFIWFFALAAAARWLAPLFARPAAWRVLDACVAAMMWFIAFSLLTTP